MKTGLYYRIDFQNFEGDLVRIDIGDTDVQIDDALDPQYIQLRGSGDPLHIKVINNDEDKFTPIRAKQAVIQFMSDASYNASTFADGSDNRYNVSVTLNPTGTPLAVFLGFLVLSDIEQPFQPVPQVVTLTASDHLGLLKDVPLADDASVNLRGKYKIAELIAFCLKKTGLTLSINVINNMRVGSGSYVTDATFDAATNNMIVSRTSFFYVGQTIRISNTSSNNGTFIVLGTGTGVITINILSGTLVDETPVNVVIEDISSERHLYDVIYLDALTFEASVGVAESCYDVLSKILTDDCFLTQYAGEWWICRVDEYDQYGPYRAIFDADGVYQSIAFYNTINQYLGADRDKQFIDADAVVRYERGMGFIKETYHYDYPEEVICNITFDRGDFIADLPDETVDDTTFQAKSYSPECWTIGRYYVNDLTPTASTADLYIKRLFFNDYEDNRYLVVGYSGESDPFAYARSEAFTMDMGDKVSISVEMMPSVDTIGGGILGVLGVVLFGNSGDYYTLNTFGGWNKNSGLGHEEDFFGTAIQLNYTSTEEKQQFNTGSVESQPTPESGDLYLYLPAGNINGGSGTPDFYYNVNFTYIPLINGSYQKYLGQYHQVTRVETGYIAKREGEVFISDAPKQSFKGAMFIFDGSEYRLVSRYYSSSQFSLGPPASQDFVNRYGYHQAFAVWNQYRNTIRKFTGTGISLGASWGDVIHRYSLTDNHPDSNGRYFLLISFDQNWKSCQFSATFIEVYNFYTGKTYTDPWVFKYLSA